MSVKMSRIIEVMEGLAPVELAEEWDNVGLLAGRRDADVSSVLVALDALDAVVDESIALGANALITHHPTIFRPIHRINDDTPQGRRLLRLIENKINLYCAHTNLDSAPGGINDMLFDIFGLRDRELICENLPGVFQGRAGTLPAPMRLPQFALMVKDALGLANAVYCGSDDVLVSKVGIIGGGSANPDFFTAVRRAGCDTFITADIKLSAAQAALDMGLNLVDATHYGGEVIFAERLADYLRQRLDIEVVVSKVNGQPFKTVSCGGEQKC